MLMKERIAKIKRHFRILFLCLCGLLVASCYQSTTNDDQWSVSESSVYSLDFMKQHHYGLNYNFKVCGDSLWLQSDRPMHTDFKGTYFYDSLYLQPGDLVVVADLAIIPEDSVDSVWVKVARDQSTMGWVHESSLLEQVVPDDSISEFIHVFSNKHLLYFLSALVVLFVLYLVRRMRRKRFRMVFFDDISSCYPTGLCLVISTAAVLYALIQQNNPSLWVDFYFHPTLNPFGQPFILGAFLSAVWLMLILSIAVVDDVLRQLSVAEAIPYLLGLLGVCMLCYLFFSIATLYYLGIPCLLGFIVWALRHYYQHGYSRYICGKCGAKISKKGTCPRCGAWNE